MHGVERVDFWAEALLHRTRWRELLPVWRGRKPETATAQLDWLRRLGVPRPKLRPTSSPDGLIGCDSGVPCSARCQTVLPDGTTLYSSLRFTL